MILVGFVHEEQLLTIFASFTYYTIAYYVYLYSLNRCCIFLYCGIDNTHVMLYVMILLCL